MTVTYIVHCNERVTVSYCSVYRWFFSRGAPSYTLPVRVQVCTPSYVTGLPCNQSNPIWSIL